MDRAAKFKCLSAHGLFDFSITKSGNLCIPAVLVQWATILFFLSLNPDADVSFAVTSILTGRSL